MLALARNPPDTPAGSPRFTFHARFARSPRVCDFAAGHFDARSGLSSPMGQAHTDRALDGPDLALCLCHGRARLFGAIQVVPSGECDTGNRA